MTDLSNLILSPIKNSLTKKRLLIVADGVLNYVPFAALPNPQTNEPLIVSQEIVTLPSASTLAVMRKELDGRKLAPKTVAVLADPVFDTQDERYKTLAAGKKNAPQIEKVAFASKTRGANSNETDDLTRTIKDFMTNDTEFAFSRLPFTRKEAEAITNLVPNSQRKLELDFSANRANTLTADLTQYRFIHFATHSFMNSQRPELSGIVLSLIDENGAPQDGFLRSDEIFNLKLPAELVVLSGCRTGLGKEIRGEGLIGLTRGFMYAGAKRVAVSLWDVNDEATSVLMANFYREMLGNKKLSPASALRQAQISMIKDKRWNNPYYWSGFILQGEPK